DAAWASAEVLELGELEQMLASYPGVVYRPTRGSSPTTLACPTPGSLASLRERFTANSERLAADGVGRGAKVLFAQPPKPRFAEVAYEAPGARLVYALRRSGGDGAAFAAP